MKSAFSMIYSVFIRWKGHLTDYSLASDFVDDCMIHKW